MDRYRGSTRANSCANGVANVESGRMSSCEALTPSFQLLSYQEDPSDFFFI